MLLLALACAPKADRAPAATDSAPVAETSTAAPSDAPTIVILGTSLTAGFGVDPDQAYPAVLQRMLDSAGLHYRIVNAGVSGESSAGALRRIGWVLSRPPAVLIIETG
ncbi:MAG TPA: GDSL-type esterase/lipase family protein, partial [Gemmatimonadales bacterium]|nr:GDSL-type esterase/lipase family protein [Gemmatimonadales bacterium]